MKKIDEAHRLLKDTEYTKKIQIFFSSKSVAAGFDQYEKSYTYTRLNPVTIRGLVRSISPEALVWKQYGLNNIGSVEVVTESKYKGWFQNADRVDIEGVEYTVFKEGTGGKSIIQDRVDKTIRVVLQRR